MCQTVVCVLSKGFLFICVAVFLFFTGTLKCATAIVGGDGDYWPRPTYILLQILCLWKKTSAQCHFVSEKKKIIQQVGPAEQSDCGQLDI